jgi:hypothetical protein
MADSCTNIPWWISMVMFYSRFPWWSIKGNIYGEILRYIPMAMVSPNCNILWNPLMMISHCTFPWRHPMANFNGKVPLYIYMVKYHCRSPWYCNMDIGNGAWWILVVRYCGEFPWWYLKAHFHRNLVCQIPMVKCHGKHPR